MALTFRETSTSPLSRAPQEGHRLRASRMTAQRAPDYPGCERKNWEILLLKDAP